MDKENGGASTPPEDSHQTTRRHEFVIQATTPENLPVIRPSGTRQAKPRVHTMWFHGHEVLENANNQM